MIAGQSISLRLEPRCSDDQDSVLVRSSKSGDSNAFSDLVKKHRKRVFWVAHTITCSFEDAEDICQNVFVNVWKHLPEFQERARFSSWLTRIAVNESLMQLRRRKSVISLDEATSEDGEGTFQVRDLRPSPEELYSNRQVREILSSGLERLRPAIRLVFVLRHIEGLSTEETAEAVGASAGAVKTRLLKARRALRSFLERRISRRPRAATTSAAHDLLCLLS